MNSREINKLLTDSNTFELPSDFSAKTTTLTSADFSFFDEMTNLLDSDVGAISSSIDTDFQRKPSNKKRKKTPREKQHVNSETGPLLQEKKGNFFQDGIPYKGEATLPKSFKRREYRTKQRKAAKDRLSSFLLPSIPPPNQLTLDPFTPFPESPELTGPYPLTDEITNLFSDEPTFLSSPTIDISDEKYPLSTHMESYEEEKTAIQQDPFLAEMFLNPYITQSSNETPELQEEQASSESIPSSTEIKESWLEELKYNKQQREKIIEKIKDFETFKEHHLLLVENQFTNAAIVKLLKHTYRNIEAIVEYLNNYQEKYKTNPRPAWILSADQLTKIASRVGGSKNLQAITDYVDKHQTFYENKTQPAWVLSVDQLMKIVNHTGGSKNLQAITDYLDKHRTSYELKLKPAWVLSVDQLIMIVNHAGGSKNLQAVTDYLDKHQACYALKLKPAGVLSVNQLIKIVSHDGGSKNLQAFTDYVDKHQAFYAPKLKPAWVLSVAQLTKIVSRIGGSKNLQAVTDYLDKHRTSYELKLKPAWILSINQLIEISTQHGGGAININFIIAHEKQIKSQQIPINLLVSALKKGKKGRDKLLKEFSNFSTKNLPPVSSNPYTLWSNKSSVQQEPVVLHSTNITQQRT